MSIRTEVEVLRTKARLGIERLNTLLFQRSGAWLGWYVLALIVAGLVFQLARPIVMGDTDMWYHLSGGRFFWTSGEIPDHPYFSFAFNDRDWIAYFWGFQALIYPVFDTFGYQGLIIIRALLFTTSVAVIATYVYQSNQRSWNWPLVAVVILYLLLLDGRATQLRPHLVSYAMIPLFLLILEHRRRWLPALPFLTVLWSNLHGVEWVVGATVVGAYFIEGSIGRFRSGGEKTPTTDFLWLLACVPALLVNPFGWNIFKAPFAIPGGLTQFILELQPISPMAFVNVSVSALDVGNATLLTALMLLVVAAFGRGLLHGGIRISHAITALAGLALLTRGNRFLYEWALLSLPLVTSSAMRIRLGSLPTIRLVLPAVLAISLLLVPLHALWGSLPKAFNKYPLNEEGLPAGISIFLTQQAASGNLLISPSYGGYVNWALYPNILIHSDMEFPPFDGTAALQLSYATGGNMEAIRKLVSQYKVDFIALEIKKTFGIKLEKEFGFKAVYFDDNFVLYAHQDKQETLVHNNQIQFIDPHNLLNNKGSIDEQLAELEKIRKQWPSGRRVNHAITYLLLKEKRYAEAERAAARFTRYHPDDPNSYYLAGDVLEQQDRFDEARSYYRKSMDFADEDFRRILNRHIGTCHYLEKNFLDAYEAFSEGVYLLTQTEDPETIYQYAYSAIVAGDISGARRLLEALIWTTPETNQKLLDDARSLLAKIDGGELAAPGPLEFLSSLFTGNPVGTEPR